MLNAGLLDQPLLCAIDAFGVLRGYELRVEKPTLSRQ